MKQSRTSAVRVDGADADHRRHTDLLIGAVAKRVPPEQLHAWFRSLLVVSATESQVVITATSQFVRDWLAKNHSTVLAEAVHEIGDQLPGGRRAREWTLTLRAEDGNDSLSDLPRETATPPPNAPVVPARDEVERPAGAAFDPVRRERARPAANSLGSPLNSNYTSERFVVGPSNRLAHAAALAIGENPGHAYNPLFVHGDVGLGKTHLMQAICHTVLRRNPDARVLYTSCENFTHAYVQAIQTKELDAFRDFHRGVDVLVIDDVQFLANKDKTQDEFFHTFNELFDQQRQIVLSSDRPPAEIPAITERLVSRFKWGLIAEITAPAAETRRVIARQKAAARNVELSDEVAKLLADHVTSNIRELEGAVIKLLGVAALTNQAITRELAESCLPTAPTRRAHATADEIIDIVTNEFSVTKRQLDGRSRTQAIAIARQIAMFLIREHTENSLEEIGRLFGNRDHTTVLYGIEKIRRRTQEDRTFKALVDKLSEQLETRASR